MSRESRDENDPSINSEFKYARSIQFGRPVNAPNDLNRPKRDRLETLSCPKLFPVEETSKLRVVWTLELFGLF